LQRTCECGAVAGLTGDCEECANKRLGQQWVAASPPSGPGGPPSDGATLSVSRKEGRFRFHDLAIHSKERLGIQPKLRIGQPNDKYEQEADRVADQVMRLPEPRLRMQPIGKPVWPGVVQRYPLVSQTTPLVQRQAESTEEEEEETLQPKPLVSEVTPLVQRQAKLPEEEEKETVQAKPVSDAGMPVIQPQEVEEDEEGEIVQPKPISHQSSSLVQRQSEVSEEEEENLQPKPLTGQIPHLVQQQAESPHRRSIQASNPIVSSNIQSQITHLRGSGQPIPQAKRAFFEPRFKADFSGVRIHTDSRAADTARAMGARAFTSGQDIVFGASQYQPESTEGQRLLAHELTHVVQQQGAKPFDQKASAVKPSATETPQTAEIGSVQRACPECKQARQQQPPEEAQDKIIQTKSTSGDLPEIFPDATGAPNSELIQPDQLTTEIQKNSGLSSIAPNIQRQPESASPGGAPVSTGAEPTTETTTEETAASALIVDDEVDTLEPGQMKKSEFLNELRTAVCQTAEAALAKTDQTTNGCPYLEYWFNHYRNKDSQHIERAIHKYAPETARATTAREYIAPITGRVGRAVSTWAETGEITGVPEGVSLPGIGLADAAGSLFSGIAGAASRVASGAGRLLSGIGNLLFKGREGGARATENPQAIQTQLGDGRPLDGGVRSRMESAFGTNFSNVRLHTDAKASGLSSHFNARAFTVGEHVAFGAGEYQPGTLIGDALIAHELAHTVQQKDESELISPLQMNSTGYNALEQDADKSAVGAVINLLRIGRRGLADISEKALPRLKSGLRLQRCVEKCPPGKTYYPRGGMGIGSLGPGLCRWECLPTLPEMKSTGYTGPSIGNAPNPIFYLNPPAATTFAFFNANTGSCLCYPPKDDHDQPYAHKNFPIDCNAVGGVGALKRRGAIKGAVKRKPPAPSVPRRPSKRRKPKKKTTRTSAKKGPKKAPQATKKLKLPNDIATACRISSINCGTKLPDKILSEVPKYPKPPGHSVPFPKGPYIIRKSALSGASRVSRTLQKTVLENPSSWPAAFRSALNKVNGGAKNVNQAVANGTTKKLKWPVDASGEAWQVHHIKPVSFGGDSSIRNLFPLPGNVHRQFNSWWTKVQNRFKARFSDTEWNALMTDKKSIPASKATGKKPR
jgi:hypothetical protein